MDPITNSHGKPNALEIMDKFLAQGLPKEDSSIELPAAVAEILAGASFKLVGPVNPGKSFNDQIMPPDLDEPDTASAAAIDWAVLAAKIKEDNDKYQSRLLALGIKKQQGDIEAHAKEQLDKVNDSLKKMDKAAKMGLFMKIFGWLMVGISIVAAIATCGMAGGLVVGAVAGAAAGVALQVLNETGVMEKLTKAITDALKKGGCKSPAAEILGAVFTALLEIGVALGASVGSSFAVGKKFANLVDKGMRLGLTKAQAMEAATKLTFMRMMSHAVEGAQKLTGRLKYLPMIMKGMEEGLKLLGYAVQPAAAKVNLDYGLANAKVREEQAVRMILAKKLEEMTDALNEVLMQLMNSPEVIAKLLINTDEGKLAIAARAEQMA